MKQKHADSPSAFLAAAMAVTGAAMLLCPLIGQNTEMNRSAAEYDDLRVQLKSEEPAQATDAPAQGKSALRVLLGFPGATQEPLELPKTDEFPPEIDIGTGADLAACLAQNDDFIAWIRSPGTNVDYSIVWTDDAEYYLHHTFTGKQGAAGTLFSLMKTDYSIPSRNIAIYGHHLKSTGEKMFTSLMRYKDADFYAGHETVLLDTLYESGSYRIFAVLNFHSGEWDSSQANFESDAAFLEFIRYARRNALYDTGVTVGAEDSILTLITCDRSGAVLAGATFELTNASGTVAATQTTGADGAAHFDNLPAGNYTVREINAPTGYLVAVPDSQSVTVTAGGTTGAAFANERIQGRIRIAKTDSLTKEPLAGAEFTIIRTDGTGMPIVLTTDVNGNAETDWLDYGRYRMTESKVPAHYETSGFSTEIDCTENGKTYLIEVENEPTKGFIQIVKTDALDGRPIAGR